MYFTPFFTRLTVETSKALRDKTYAQTYDVNYLASDFETLRSNLAQAIDSEFLQKGYGLLNSTFSIYSLLDEAYSESMVGFCIGLYRPTKYEAFCKIGQEHSMFHEVYFDTCRELLRGKINEKEFIDLIKFYETQIPCKRRLYRQEFILGTSFQKFDESISVEEFKKVNGISPLEQMVQKAITEEKESIRDGIKLVDFNENNPSFSTTYYRNKYIKQYIVLFNEYRLRELTTAEAFSMCFFDKPTHVKKTRPYYKNFLEASTLYLMSKIDADEFYRRIK